MALGWLSPSGAAQSNTTVLSQRLAISHGLLGQ